MPAVAEFLKNAEATRRIVKSKYSHLKGEELLDVTIEENVLMQIENLQTHPAVAVSLAEGKLKLHAWVYDIASGEVYAFDSESEQFAPLGEVRPAAMAFGPNARLSDVHSGDARFHQE
jgi:carbonic anhydrase